MQQKFQRGYREEGNKRSRLGLREFFQNKTRNMTMAALLIAMIIIFTRFMALQLPIVRISLEFIPIALSAILFGPVVGALCASIADLLGMIAFPSGQYFPGFTISAGIYAFIYGIFLYGREIKLKNTMLCVLVNVLVVDFVLIGLWLHILYQMPYDALIAARTIKCAILYPVQVTTIYFGIKAIKKSLNLKLDN